MASPTVPASWIDTGESLLHDMIALRRAIHEEPELGLHLPKTTAKAKAALAGLPLEIREGPSTTGFVAVLRGPANGRTVLLRGDMDALPLVEDTGLAFSSRTHGAMHACGHDTHVAMLVGAARALCARRDELAGSVAFMFQPGEEGWHGARYMLDDGLIDPLPDAAFALHISPNMPTGVFASREGPLLASSDTIAIKVTGAGGHASMPHDAVDLAERTATTLYGEGAWITMPNPMMGAEDFSYVLNEVPGLMAFIGAAPVEAADFRSCCALHSNRMVIEEAVMARGIAMHCAFAEAVLAGEMAT